MRQRLYTRTASASSRTHIVAACAALLALIPGTSARAWIYPEHRAIGIAAMRGLPPAVQAYYDALWQRARVGYSPGLCESAAGNDRPARGPSDDKSPCIDFAAWAAIAGDHSCSPDQLINEVLPSDWVHDVARVSEAVRLGLAEADSPDDRENLWITSNLRLQEVDSEYVTRAGGNNAHFLLSQQGEGLDEFIAHSTRKGAPLNALGLYRHYHAAALRVAAMIGPDPSGAAATVVLRVLALEAYALHFLQDMYASGHVAGSWGDAAVRKGTHDHYCAHGFATSSWSGDPLVMFGDAHIQPRDLERTARAMAQSLTQLFSAATAAGAPGQPPTALDRAALEASALDACRLLEHPSPPPMGTVEREAIEAVLSDTPRPGYGPESVAWPRYRADFGPFIGFESSLAIGGAFGGFDDATGRAVAELGMGVRFGYGLEGVVAALNTGTMYLQVGLARQSEQVDVCTEDCRDMFGGPTLPRVPSRAGLALALRLPFWLIPGDLLILAPVLALVSPTELTRVAIRAASGGLIPWQRTISTSVGHFEFVAGRLIGATFFGASQRVRSFAYLEQPEGETFSDVGFRSVTLTFPVLEYTPLRIFAQTLTAALHVHLAYAIDIPFDTVRYDDRSLPGPDWGPTHMFLLRLVMEGRGYL